MRQFLSLNPRAFMRRRFVAVIVAAASLGAVGLTAAGPAAAPAAAENNGLGAVPLMGWSNWSYIGDDPTTAKIEAQASAMVSTGLHSAGWDYINVDDYYYLCNSTGPEVNAYGLWVTDPSKFPPSGSTPGMEVLANYVHGLGLKFGMYVTPGIPENAVNANTPVQGTSYTAAEIANTSVSEHNYNCGHMYGLNYSSPGAQDYINSWADELASWGVDYVKLDGVNSSDIPDVQAWSAALRQTGRPMWLELSNDLPIADHSYWQEYSNGWRTNGDIECYCWPGGAKSTNPARTPLTTWSNVAGRFGTLASWYPYAGPGGWLDFDSLEVGNGPTNDGISDPEAQSMMTLWSMGASNLILGTNLTALTPTDLGYLKNTAVLSVDQDGLAAHRVVDSGSGQVFVKTESNGDCVLAYFDTSGTSSASVSANVSSACGFTSGTATNLWTGASLGTLSGTYTVNLGAGATELLRIVPSGGTTTTTSGGSSYPSGYHTLVVDNDGLCVEVAGASTSNGAAIDQNTCSGGTNQEFQFNPVSGGYGELQAESDGKDVVVASASTAEGAKVIQYTQNGTTNGLWLPIAQSDGSWQFKNENSGYCLDVTGAVNTPGTQLQQWGCKSPAAGTNQAYMAK
jgi:alpha-galactosidase